MGKTAQSTNDIFVHPQALVESTHIGPRTRIWAFAHVMEGAVVGADCNVGECVFIEAGAQIGDRVTIKNGVQVWMGVTCDDDVFMGPNATLTNDLRPRSGRRIASEDFPKTHLGRGASVGANATIVAGVAIGAHAMIGAGCVVIRSVLSHALVVGNPARQVGWVCTCGAKLVGEGGLAQGQGEHQNEGRRSKKNNSTAERWHCSACDITYGRHAQGLQTIDVAQLNATKVIHG